MERTVSVATREINLGTQSNASLIFGNLDANISFIEKEFLVGVIGRGAYVTVTGDEKNVAGAEKALNAMLKIISDNGAIDEQTVRYCVNMVKSGEDDLLCELGECDEI